MGATTYKEKYSQTRVHEEKGNLIAKVTHNYVMRRKMEGTKVVFPAKE